MSTTSTRRRIDSPRVGPGEVGMLVAFLAIAFGVGALGALTTVGAVDGWYARSPKVPWTPPDFVFGPVWTVLYALIAVSGWLVWRRRTSPGATVALWLFVVQLVLNSLWTPIFFGAFPLIGPAALWLALVVILALDVAVAATIAAFRRVSRLAALLLVPYLAWILYASTLNWGDAALVAHA